MLNLLPLLPLFALVYLFAALQRLAARKPAYSHITHTISELGEWGSPVQRQIARGVFLPVAFCLLPLVYGFYQTSPPVAWLALCLATGYLTAALFPCDPGSPMHGSWRQGLHNLGGGVEYIGGGLSLLEAATAYGPFYRFVGYGALAAAVLLGMLPVNSPRGLLQRLVEVGLFGALTCLSWQALGIDF